ESAAGTRRSASCGGTRVTVPNAWPSCESTTTWSPGPSSSTTMSGRRKDVVRPAGANFTLTKGRRAGSDMSDVQGHSVGDDLGTGVAVERHQGAVHVGKGLQQPIRVERSQQRLQLRLQVRIGQGARL